MRVAAVTLVVLAASSASAESVAVLAVDLGARAGGEDHAADASVALADVVRDRLAQQHAGVLARDTTGERLASLGVGVGFTLASLKERLAAAERAQQELEVDRSIDILEGVLQDLDSDGDYNAEKQALHEEARLRVATRLMALAGPDEDGAATTERGVRALAHLTAAARVNPTLTLSEAEHPPKMRRLLARAQSDLRKAGLGGLEVDSTPPGATVVVEGRAVGLTPLRLLDQLPRGTYRVWLELDGAKSATRRLEVGERPGQLEVDLAFEGALWRGGPGLRPLADGALDLDTVTRAAALVETERLVLVGVASHLAFGARVNASTGAIERRVAIAIAGATATPAEIDGLLARLDGAAAAEDDLQAPARFLPSGGVRAAAITTSAAGGDDMWLWIVGGTVVAGVVVAGLVGAGAAVWAVSTPAAGRFDVELVP